MKVLFVAFAVVAAAAGCGKSSDNPTAPTPPVDLTGTFSGPVSDRSGPGRLTWRITQSNADVTGTFTASDAASGVSASGAVSGTLSGGALTFRMTTAAGTLPPPFAGCSISIDGTAEVTASSIEGTYSGRNSCTGAFGDGRLSLTKQ